MNWMLLPLKRYAKFSGRARPKEFWMFILFLLLCMTGLAIVETTLGLGHTQKWVRHDNWNYAAGAYHEAGLLVKLFLLGIIIPKIAVAVRRLHDSDKSGWWVLLWLIPFIGWIILFIFLVRGGTRGPNRFGDDPVEVGEGMAL